MSRQHTQQWRVLYDEPASGPVNMAADEASLRAVAAGEVQPTLRLYGWQTPCLSLGAGQRWEEVDYAALQARGWGLIRRLTGGGAILHADELTYSVVLPADHPIARQGVIESYRAISQGIMAALIRLGLRPSALPIEGHAPRTTICFETPSHYEITVGGRKLVGSAQARRFGGLLQHGTLPLTGNLGRIADVLNLSAAERLAAQSRIHDHALTLEAALGNEQVDWSRAARAFVEGFSQALSITFTQAKRTDSEQTRMIELAERMYGQDAWTKRR